MILLIIGFILFIIEIFTIKKLYKKTNVGNGEFSYTKLSIKYYELILLFIINLIPILNLLVLMVFIFNFIWIAFGDLKYKGDYKYVFKSNKLIDWLNKEL